MSAQVRPGYKLTEVGVIPEDWKVLPLRYALTHGRLGGNYSNSEVEQSKPLMKMGNLARGYFQLDKIEYISDRQHADPNHRLCLGDLLFNTRNTLDLVGKVAIWRAELPVAYYNSNLMRLEFDSKIISSSMFANYILNTSSSISRLRAIATGTTSVAAIYTRDLMQFMIPAPPHTEQRAIATALSDMDALISGLDQLIAKKRDIKQAAMQQLLTGQQRLPGFSGVWDVKRLGDVGVFLKGSGVKRDQSLSGDLPCIRYGEIYTVHNDYIRDFKSYISVAVSEDAVLIKCGDILFAGSGETKEDIGKCVSFVDDIDAYAGGDIVILRPKNVDSLFLGYALNTPTVSRQKASRGQGDAVVHISANALATVEVLMPSQAEQAAIATILSDMDSELATLETRAGKARQLKQGMMQELLTGRIRLVSPGEGPLHAE